MLVNLLIAFSWCMAVANRLHIDADSEVWKRFPGVCPYCSLQPCQCKAIKPATRQRLSSSKPRPVSLNHYQAMFEAIYPASSRTLADAGVHLAEETGEVSEAIHNYLGQHSQKLFKEIPLEIADYISCLLGVANSAQIDVAAELEKFYAKNCHVCHKAPCECSFTAVATIAS